MDLLDQGDISASLLNVPYSRRWDLLRPVIEKLYVKELRKLSDVSTLIKDQCGFNAAESQYKYQIKKWKLKKSASTTKKEALYRVVKNRAQQGKPSVFTREGQNFDTKNFLRYFKSRTRSEITLRPVADAERGDHEWTSVHFSRQFGYRIFLNWNMPYGALRSSSTKTGDHVSPLSDITVATPASHHGPPSPMALAIKSMTSTESARLFVEGRHNELLQSMGKAQRVTMSTWMYQFWLFSFKTAKHWGRGPQNWTADILGFNNYTQKRTIPTSLPGTPGGGVSTPASHPTPQEGATPVSSLNLELQPSSLCRWSIHCEPVAYQRIPSPLRSPDEQFDVDDEESWPVWPRNIGAVDFTEKLTDGIENNHFSSLEAKSLPIVTDQVASAARRSPEELLKESLGFSIMGRNERLLEELLDQEPDLAATGLHPFHLATSYLDGSQTCCSILEMIQEYHPPSLRKLYVNDLGHTILDQLMICILKSHTSCSPNVVDEIFKKDKRFEGEDVNICGRWDADSECVRTLLTNGIPGIPFKWKHMFCHTSSQTICHCIGTIFGPNWGPDINHPSGLFGRRCMQCGVKLQLLPLHTLVLVTLHLSLSGCQGETLFGALACLLCLLRNGADPLLQAEISLKALIGDEEVSGCSHQKLDPLQLAEEALFRLRPTWSEELDRGWQIFCNVLRLEREDRVSDDISDSEDDEEAGRVSLFEQLEREAPGMKLDGVRRNFVPIGCPTTDDHESHFGRTKILGILWAAVQTELLTYRRLGEGDPWISPNFDMYALNQNLMNGHEPTIPLLQNGMMKPFCRCGNFPRAVPASPTIVDSTAYHFSNLEDWKRSTFLNNFSNRWDSWYGC